MTKQEAIALVAGVRIEDLETLVRLQERLSGVRLVEAARIALPIKIREQRKPALGQQAPSVRQEELYPDTERQPDSQALQLLATERKAEALVGQWLTDVLQRMVMGNHPPEHETLRQEQVDKLEMAALVVLDARAGQQPHYAAEWGRRRLQQRIGQLKHEAWHQVDADAEQLRARQKARGKSELSTQPPRQVEQLPSMYSGPTRSAGPSDGAMANARVRAGTGGMLENT